MPVSVIHPQNSGRGALQVIFTRVVMTAAAMAVASSAVLAAPQTGETGQAAADNGTLQIETENERQGVRLLEAIGVNDLSAIRYLLESGADPNFQEGEPLISASMRGAPEIVSILLEKGARCDMRQGKALTLAALRGHTEVIDLLLNNPWSKADPKADNHWALANASRNGFHHIVRTLIQAGADVDGNHGYALANAILGDQSETFHVLLDEFNANPNAGNGMLLQMAIESGNRIFVEKLLQKGALSNLPAVNDAIMTIENARQNGNVPDPAFDAIITLVRKHQEETKQKTKVTMQSPSI